MSLETNEMSNSGALRYLTELAGQARGVELDRLNLGEGFAGLPGAVPVAIKHGTTPELFSVKRLFEEWRVTPEARRGEAKALTLRAFIALVNHHKTKDSALFAETDWRQPGFLAVLDYHPAAVTEEKPAWGRHRVSYKFPLSEEWRAWVKQHGEAMAQADFAAFLEDHIAELSAPSDREKLDLERDFGTSVATPAELMRLSRGLAVTVNSVVKNVVTLQSGEAQIAFEETHSGADGKPLKAPGLFILNVAPFFMGEPTRIPVRLRYRVSEGKLRWSFWMHRPDVHVTQRVRDDLAEAASATDLLAFEAIPEIGSGAP